MSRNKRLLPALLLALAFALALPAGVCAAVSENLLDAGSVTTEDVRINTVTVEVGDYVRTYSASGSEYYPYTYTLRCETEGAKFKEYTVKRSQEVKAGDVLAVFTLERDEVALATQQLALTRAQETLEARRETGQERIDALAQQLALTADRAEREQLRLQIAYEQVLLEKELYEQTIKIADTQRAIAELEERSANNVLRAPADGVVTNLAYMREGDRVAVGDELVTLRREDGMLIRVDNANDYFRYGMRVNVEVGPAKNRTTLTGTVVGADTLVPESRRSHQAFIRLDPCDEELRLINPTAKAPTQAVGNALLVPRQVVTLEAGKYYVTKYVGGALQKRYVQLIGNNPTHAWLMQGVEAGETLVVD